MVRCADRSLYTGVTVDIERRISEHNGDRQLGAKYTRARRPVDLVYKEVLPTRSDACKRETEIKQLKKSQKERLVVTAKNDLVRQNDSAD